MVLFVKQLGNTLKINFKQINDKEVHKKIYCFSKVGANRETKINDTQIKNEAMR